MAHCSRLLVVALATACVFVRPAAAAQWPVWLGGSATKVQFVEFKDPDGRFSIDRPKDWQVVAGAGDTVVTFLQKKLEGQLVVGRYRLALSLGPDDITETFASDEVRLLKGSQPNASNISSQFVRKNGRPIVIIDFERPPLKGADLDRVRQYSFPVGQDDFRLTGSARKALFPKYDLMFAHMAETFKVLPAKAGTAAPGR